MLHKGPIAKCFSGIFEIITLGEIWGEFFWILAELKNSFFEMIENHITRNYQIRHFLSKTINYPHGDYGVLGGVGNENY